MTRVEDQEKSAPATQISYAPGFYSEVSLAASEAARQVVPVILSAVSPQSVVDVGCAEGVWARAFHDAGVPDVTGVDGTWVDLAKLAIPADRFVRKDLTQPFTLLRRFDLCICLETAEHLPDSRAEGFVADLTALSDVVVFSAAIPFQGGTHHLNERWQSYWVDKFAARGYVGVDYLRRRIWHLTRRNAWFYAQNVIVFVRQEVLDRYPALADEYRYQAGPPVSVVHPGLLVLLEPWEKNLSIRIYFGLLPRMLARVVSSTFRRLTGRPPAPNHVLPPGATEWLRQ